MKKLLLILILFVACIPVRINNFPKNMSPVVEKDLWIDSEFSESQTYLIEQAAESWEDATRGMIKINLHKNYTIPNRKIASPLDRDIIIKVNGSDPFISKQSAKTKSGVIVGLTAQAPDLTHNWVMIINDRITYSSHFKTIATHEIGHLMIDYGHQNEGPAIMNEQRDKFIKCLTRFDLEFFCNKFDCDVEELNYCDPYDLRNQLSY